MFLYKYVCLFLFVCFWVCVIILLGMQGGDTEDYDDTPRYHHTPQTYEGLFVLLENRD